MRTNAGRLPSLTFLRTFESVARHRSFTQAAEELCLTPSAVSHRIRAVEEALGARLFARHIGGIELTGAGRTLLQGVESGLERIYAACDQVSAMQGARTITISAPPPLGMFWLSPNLAEFSASRPDIQVRLILKDGEPDLERDGIDLALVRLRSETLSVTGEQPFLRERMFPVCSPSLATPDRPLQQPLHLARHILLHEEQYTSPEFDWSVWLDRLGVKSDGVVRGPRYSHFALAIAAAQQGQGVAIGRSPHNDRDLLTGTLVRPFGALEVQSTRAFVARFSRSTGKDSRVRAIYTHLLSRLRSLAPEPALIAQSA